MSPIRSRKQNSDEPLKKTIYTIVLEEEQQDKLLTILKEGAYFDYEVAHARYAYKGDGCNVVCYTSGKLVIQGKKTEDFVRDVLEARVTMDPLLGYDEVHHPEWFESHAGLDESGKGDFFGPLVVACVIADGDAVRGWMEAGIRDSKSVTSDVRILALEKEIRKTKGVVVETVFAGMEKYNALHRKFQSNTNHLMAWMHATALKEALKKKPVTWGMLDQFSKQPLVQRNIRDQKDFELRMETKAERDPVVAAASIVARALYVRQMGKLSKEFGEPLKRGASAQVREQGVKLVRKLGAEALPRFAKTHFKTAREVLDLAS